jgi:hypothetical protein
VNLYELHTLTYVDIIFFKGTFTRQLLQRNIENMYISLILKTLF